MKVKNAYTYKLLALKIVAAIFIGLFSFFVLSDVTTSEKFVGPTIERLDEQKADVMKLTAASAGLSTAISFLPDDWGTPVADELAQLTKLFLIALCAIFLEKVVVSLSGYVVFRWLVPIACICYLWSLFSPRETSRIISKKILIFSVSLFLIVPVGVKISTLVENTFDYSMEETISDAQESADIIESSAGSSADEGLIAKISSTLKSIGTGITDLGSHLQQMVLRFTEALAVMLVTSVLIPVLILLIYGWLIKILFNTDIPQSVKVVRHGLEKANKENRIEAANEELVDE